MKTILMHLLIYAVWFASCLAIGYAAGYNLMRILDILSK